MAQTKEEIAAKRHAYYVANRKDRKERDRAYYLKNRERIIARQKAKQKLDYATDPTSFHKKTRKWMLKKKYGVSLEGYAAMFEQQDGKCAICRRTYDKRLQVDHCHSTGKVRGLLCRSCNVGIGFFEDQPRLLKAAIKYLQINQNSHGDIRKHKGNQ